MINMYVFIISLIILIAFSLNLYIKNRDLETPVRLLTAVIPAGYFLAFCQFLLANGTLPAHHWSEVRLVPSIALAEGFRLYYGPEDGPISGWIYPPVAPLAYLPSLVWDSPGQRLRAAGFLSGVYYFFPAYFLMWTLSRRDAVTSTRSRTYFNAAFLLLCFYSLFDDYLSHTYAISCVATTVHCDAPALGCAALACAFLLRSQSQTAAKRGRDLVVSSIFAALAVWSKQVMVPLLVVLPAWVVLTQGFRAAIRHAAILLGTFVSISAALVLAFGFRDMFFNIVTIPSRHPWVGRFPFNLIGVSLALQKLMYVLLVLPLAVLLDRVRTGRNSSWPDWFSENGWMLPLMAGVCLFPTSVLGRMKVGGDLNAFSYSLYPILIASCALLFGLLARPRPDSVGRLGEALVATLVGLVTLIQAQNIGSLLNHPRDEANSLMTAVHYIEKHPGQAYFPSQPMAHLMAEGKLYHFEYGMVDRELAGYKVSASHFAANVPPNCYFVCFPPEFKVYENVKFLVEGLLKGFEPAAEMPELPGWTCYRRRR